MLELLQRLTAINSYAKDCHYNYQSFGQHLLADKNQDELIEGKDLVNEVCYLGLGMDTPASEEVLEGALKFIPEVSKGDQVNLARLKLLVKTTLVYIQEMKLETRGVENLIGGIAQDLQQLHGLLYKQVDDEEDVVYLNANNEKFDIVMKEFADGKLKTPDGNVVTDREQALAIAYSESKNQSDEYERIVPETM